MRTKEQVLSDLRAMLRDIFLAKESGQAHARLARAHGYVDGYMRALLELELTDKKELMEIVAAERERASGPAMRSINLVADAESSAGAATAAPPPPAPAPPDATAAA